MIAVAALLAALATLFSLALVVVGGGQAHAAAAPQHHTRVSGWAHAPGAAKAGSSYRVPLRVSGGSRAVQLQRWSKSHGWKRVARAYSARDGRVTLRWSTPRAANRVQLRVFVPASPGHRSATTRKHNVAVRRSQSQPSTQDVKVDPMLRQVLTLVNKARTKSRTCGGQRYPAVKPVRLNWKLNRAADKYAQLMADNDWFSHESPSGADPGDRIERAGYDWSSYGENIAAGYPDAASVVAGWLDSPGHCANLMGRYKELGLGYGHNPDSTYQYYWVQDFASR